jgi:DNA replication protein DnaC
VIDVQTLTRLKAMRLSGMAEYFENLADTTGNNGTLTGPEMVKMAVDWEYERRRDSKLHRLRKHAGLAQSDADIADIKAMPGRTVDTELISRLAVGSYLQKHQDVILQGPTGAGKTYVACALGNKACQQYRTVLYLSAGELFDRITIAERTGDKKRCLDTLVRVELLIIDDWFLTTPTRTQVQQCTPSSTGGTRPPRRSTARSCRPANGTTGWKRRSSPTPSSTESPPTHTPPS